MKIVFPDHVHNAIILDVMSWTILITNITASFIILILFRCSSWYYRAQWQQHRLQRHALSCALGELCFVSFFISSVRCNWIHFLWKFLVAAYVKGTTFNKIRKLFEKKVCKIPPLQSISMTQLWRGYINHGYRTLAPPDISPH